MSYNISISKLRSLFSLGVSIVASKLSLILLDMLIANIFGVSALTDSLILCLSVSTGFVNFYFIQVNRNLVGIYSGTKEENIIRGLRNFLNLNFLIFLPIILLSFYFNEQIISMIFANAGIETKVLTSVLFRYFLLLLMINIIIYNLSAFGLINNKPRIIANSNVINAIVTSTLLLFQFNNDPKVHTLGIAFLIGGICQLLYVTYSSKFPIKELLIISDIKFKEGIKIIAPVFILLLFSEYVKIYEKSISASLGDGVVSSLYYSNKLNLATLGILTSIFGYLYLPKLSKNFAINQTKFNSYIIKTFLTVFILGFFITISLNLNSSLIIDLFFNYTNKIKNISLILSTFEWYNYTSIFYMVVQIGTMIIIAMNRPLIAYIPLSVVFLIKFLLLVYCNYAHLITPLRITQIHMMSYLVGCFLTLLLIFYRNKKNS